MFKIKDDVCIVICVFVVLITSFLFKVNPNVLYQSFLLAPFLCAVSVFEKRNVKVVIALMYIYLALIQIPIKWPVLQEVREAGLSDFKSGNGIVIQTNKTWCFEFDCKELMVNKAKCNNIAIYIAGSGLESVTVAVGNASIKSVEINSYYYGQEMILYMKDIQTNKITASIKALNSTNTNLPIIRLGAEYYRGVDYPYAVYVKMWSEDKINIYYHYTKCGVEVEQ